MPKIDQVQNDIDNARNGHLKPKLCKFYSYGLECKFTVIFGTCMFYHDEQAT